MSSVGTKSKGQALSKRLREETKDLLPQIYAMLLFASVCLDAYAVIVARLRLRYVRTVCTSPTVKHIAPMYHSRTEEEMYKLTGIDRAAAAECALSCNNVNDTDISCKLLKPLSKGRQTVLFRVLLSDNLRRLPNGDGCPDENYLASFPFSEFELAIPRALQPSNLGLRVLRTEAFYRDAIGVRGSTLLKLSLEDGAYTVDRELLGGGVCGTLEQVALVRGYE